MDRSADDDLRPDHPRRRRHEWPLERLLEHRCPRSAEHRRGRAQQSRGARRLERDGRTELQSTEATPAITVLLRQFVSPLIGILLLTFEITLVQREWVDAGAIGLVLLTNAAIGF